MDAYVMGFVGIMIVLGMVTLTALVFIANEFDEAAPDNLTAPYATIRRIDTNTIETVDQAGQTQKWQRQA